MDATVSVSQGIFGFKNNFKASSISTKKSRARKSKKAVVQSKVYLVEESILDSYWYRAYQEVWEKVQSKIQALQWNSYNQIFSDMMHFIEESLSCENDTIATAAVLTGVNQLDHIAQFCTLAERISDNIDCVTIILESHNNAHIKSCIEHVIQQFIEQCEEEDVKLKKRELNLSYFKEYYTRKFTLNNKNPALVLLLADFEAFCPDVLQDLILILHSYRKTLPFIFIFGIATSEFTLHEILSYQTTSKISVKVFQSEASSVTLNKVIDEVILSPEMPFHISSRTFRLLMDIFLCYDFSVHSFITAFKFCIFEHFQQGNIYALCSSFSEKVVKHLNEDDLEYIRHLLSFRKYVESQNPQQIISLLTDDEYLRKKLPSMISDLNAYWLNFHVALMVFQQLIKILPNNSFGKNLREIYPICLSSNVVDLPEFKDIIHCVSFLSNDKLAQLLEEIMKVLSEFRRYEFSDYINEFHEELLVVKEKVLSATKETVMIYEETKTKMNLSPAMSRQDMKEKLLQAAIESKPITAYAEAANRVTKTIVDFLSKYVFPLSKAPFLFEVSTFLESDIAKSHIVGTQRAAIHSALMNPSYYFQCTCCEDSNEETIHSSIPDISIAYKLHLEHGRMINLFDWLQSFKIVLDGDNDDEFDRDDVDPKIQARFSLAVAELQFLGYIKSTKKKTDHMVRLTW